MLTKHLLRIILLILIVLFSFSGVFSFAQPPPGQDMSGESRRLELERIAEELRKRIEKEKVTPEVEEELPTIEALPESKEKIAVKEIRVFGATLLDESEIKAITSRFENRELTMRDLKEVADRITDAYRQNGYVTSRAYLPPQKIEKGIVEIRILEGMMGNIQIKGNRYFKTELLRDKITLTKGEPFNYDILRKNLVRINEHPDRVSKAVFMPGKETGTTDVVLEVKDRLPIHVSTRWDIFGSRYIEKDRYMIELTHNNLLGFDDKFTFQYLMSQASRYYMKNIRYLLPIGEDFQIGMYALLSRVKLGQELIDSDVRGKSRVYGLFMNKHLIDREDFDLILNLGFDSKHITNYQSQNVSSKDRLSIVKTGFDIDSTDEFGRTVFIYEFDYGIPDFLGSLDKKDPIASRSGAGGKFIKNNINLLRLQKLPYSSNLLWKNQFQLSPYVLSAAEQYQVGGVVNVRGYPPAEVVGDKGYAMTFEWSIPPYFVSKDVKVPYSRAKLYDALRIVMFYDWGHVHLKRPTSTEQDDRTLRSVGCGLRFNLPEDFSVRIEFAWPLDNTPSDSDHMHTWAQVSKEF